MAVYAIGGAVSPSSGIAGFPGGAGRRVIGVEGVVPPDKGWKRGDCRGVTTDDDRALCKSKCESKTGSDGMPKCCRRVGYTMNPHTGVCELFIECAEYGECVSDDPFFVRDSA